MEELQLQAEMVLVERECMGAKSWVRSKLDVAKDE